MCLDTLIHPFLGCSFFWLPGAKTSLIRAFHRDPAQGSVCAFVWVFVCACLCSWECPLARGIHTFAYNLQHVCLCCVSVRFVCLWQSVLRQGGCSSEICLGSSVVFLKNLISSSVLFPEAVLIGPLTTISHWKLGLSFLHRNSLT